MSESHAKSETIVVAADRLTAFVASIFEHKGSSADEAAAVAFGLVDANLTGHDSHGAIRTPRYVSWVDSGRVRPGQGLSVASDGGSIVVADGNFGFGQVVAPQAMDLGIERARRHGLAAVAVRDSGHMGRIGTWAEKVVAEGLAFISFVNVRSSLLVAPFGGVERRMSTAPLTIGVPTGDDHPIILDFATSAVAEGKALVALRGGKKLPPEVLIGADGQRTADPRVLYGDVPLDKVPNPMDGPGALRAFGEHKGSGLSFLLEILAGALTGAGCAGPLPRKYANNMLAIFIEPSRFQPGDRFLQEVHSYIAFFKSSKPEEQGGHVLMPGDKERIMRADRMANGVPMAGDAWAELAATARKAGLSEPEIEAALVR